MAMDFASTWSEASPEVQRRITWTISSRVLIDGGTFTEVDVRKEVAPLFAVAASSSMLRSRPGSEPQYRTLNGIVVEGIEDLADIADGVARPVP